METRSTRVDHFVGRQTDKLHPDPLEASRGGKTMGRRIKQSGLTLVELIVAFTILLILSTMALPLARVKVQREKERRLRDSLSEMRKAIDRHKDMADQGKLGQLDEDTFGYPLSLDSMVEGVTVQAMGVGGNPFGQGGMQGRGGQRGGFGGGQGRSGSMFGGQQGGSFGGRQGSSFGGQQGGSFGGRSGGGLGSQSRGGFGSSTGGGFGSQSGGGLGSSRRGSDGLGSSEGEEQKIRFLRKIPLDPITNSTDWGVRSVQDEPESMSWGGQNVFDVYTTSMDMALDGTRYSEW